MMLCIPRSRGGVSHRRDRKALEKMYSPLTRGCFSSARNGKTTRLVFPAHAGVFLKATYGDDWYDSIPRSRGGVSEIPELMEDFVEYSPLTRGCFRWIISKMNAEGVFPAHAGVFLSTL